MEKKIKRKQERFFKIHELVHLISIPEPSDKLRFPSLQLSCNFKVEPMFEY